MSKEFTVKCKWCESDADQVVANHTFTLRGLQGAYASMRRHRAEVWRTIPAVVDMADLIVWVEHDGQRLDTRVLADVVSALDINEMAGSAEWTWALEKLGIDQADAPTLPDQATWDAAQAMYDEAAKKEPGR